MELAASTNQPSAYIVWMFEAKVKRISVEFLKDVLSIRQCGNTGNDRKHVVRHNFRKIRIIGGHLWMLSRENFTF